ncbi:MULTISPECIES: hypothetical protein [Streptococcus]|uniref:hypothetical protein n=1 Tax=Streptococcus TaxID=1301 RepID=UPI001106C969|nr:MULTISPECIES: hypothetical protein [Streptococcus]
MKRDNGDLYLFKLVGIGAVLFCLFIVIGSRFVTVGVEEPKTVQTESPTSQESNLLTDLHDDTILGKFWNSKGHFVVVYDEETKVAKIYPVKEKEWVEYRVGETY